MTDSKRQHVRNTYWLFGAPTHWESEDLQRQTQMAEELIVENTPSSISSLSATLAQWFSQQGSEQVNLSHLWFTALAYGNTPAAQTLLEYMPLQYPLMPHQMRSKALDVLVEYKNEQTLLWWLNHDASDRSTVPNMFVKMCAWLTVDAIDTIAKRCEISPRLFAMGLLEACKNPRSDVLECLAQRAGVVELQHLTKGPGNIHLAQAFDDAKMLEQVTLFNTIAHKPRPTPVCATGCKM